MTTDQPLDLREEMNRVMDEIEKLWTINDSSCLRALGVVGLCFTGLWAGLGIRD